MKRHLKWLSVLATGVLAYAAISTPAAADEPAANNPNSALAPLNLNPAGLPLNTVHFNANNTLTALSAIQLAANTDLIGAELAQVDEVLRSHLGLAEGKGLVVTSVADGGPAAKSGIQKFDLLTTIGNAEIAGLDAFRKALEASPDKPIELGFIRAGKKQSVQVTPRAATVAGLALSDVAGSITHVEEKYWLGVGLAVADDTLRSQLSLPAGEGLVVTSVDNDSPAAKAGVLVNDVLLKLDGKALTTVEALTEQLQALADKSVSLELLRRGKPAMLTVTAEKHAVSWANVLAYQPMSYRVVFAPQDLTAWTTVAQPANVDFYFSAVNDATAAPASPTAQANLAKQIDDLEAQLKQLEAALAALRSSLNSSQQPADGAGKTGAPK